MASVTSRVPALPPRSGVRGPLVASTRSIAPTIRSWPARRAEMIEHQRPRPDRADRVGDPLAGDVGRRAVDRLEHRRVLAFRVDVAARRDAQAAGHGRAEIREDVAEEIRRHDHVDARRIGDHPRRQRVDVILAPRHRRVVLRHFVDHLVPQHQRIVQRVRLGRAGEQLARPLHRGLEAVARDPLDPVAREHAQLLRDFLRPSHVKPSADPAVLPLGVLADADHVDVGRGPSRERRIHAGDEAHRPQVDVLIEALADRQDQLPDRDVVRHGRIADRAEVDRVELLQPIEPVLVHHLPVRAIEIAAPRELDELDARAARRRRFLDDRDPRRDHFLPDTITSDHCYSCHITPKDLNRRDRRSGEFVF